MSVSVLRAMPQFAAGDDVAGAIAAAAQADGLALGSGDVVVIAQKIVSKAEGRTVDLADVTADPPALELAALTGRDPALARLIVDEAQSVMRATQQAIITRHRTGHVTANSGIDASNVEGGKVLLWPRDPDASARAIRAALPGRPAVIIADSLGRAWRQGTLGTAIGCAGIIATDDRRGQQDLFGRTLQATVVAIADAIAAFAVLAMGEGAEGTPVAIVRGAERWRTAEDGPGAAAIMRPVEGDLFP
ncbi:coenzyme F420-0:L-glutamate ligase [Novosphingobium sp. TH158]|uniref:coenzyme F420-0:L-glutamate ligase n=1 Tax=Novosphingobium sp. TH158 TaxID=2067455 RepID=UPI000C7E50E3|nr:coenzyme F420-0:L-glutamate ligase [Novosphingobium sp. TH158]PLK26198.1 coenzyme F420-0:L-glutamate ligase [Novosphingobium sp. TH158]